MLYLPTPYHEEGSTIGSCTRTTILPPSAGEPCRAATDRDPLWRSLPECYLYCLQVHSQLCVCCTCREGGEGKEGRLAGPALA